MLIDLHTHTRASDGTQSPAQLVAEAAEVGLDVIALTDHDTTDGWAEASAAALQHGITLVPGIEISCAVRGTSLHLLGYLHDPAYPPLVAELTRARESRVSRAKRITELLARDVDISYDDVLAQAQPGTTLGRPHIADALVARGVVADREEAFRRYLFTGSRYYARHYAPDPVDAVRLVRAAGGVPVMAHPFAAARGPIVADEVIAQMAAAGLAALEAEHPDHTPAQRDHAIGLARDLGLAVTGASDYHGAGKTNRLGQRTTSAADFEQLFSAPTATAVVRG